MYRIIFPFLIAVFVTFNGWAQDLAYAKKTIHTLTSKKFWGRGYTKNGMAKTADFIEKEFRRLRLTPLTTNGFKQNFTFPVNTFPSKINLKVDGRTLVPGKDFIVHPASKGITTTGKLIQKDSITYLSSNGNIAMSLVPKLTWSVSQQVLDFTIIEVDQKKITTSANEFSVAIDNTFVPSFMAANVAAAVKGTSKPDSVILFTAHYDHLGGMGTTTYFPGANDNASGVAMLLDLAKHYSKHPAKYTIVFIAFAAEEAGLLGSKYFTENPLIPLDSIRFLWNLDLLGNGDIGATIVNATIYPKEFALVNKINDEKKYISKINARGKAANSDHYFFTEKGVPAFFLYTQGGVSAYHDVDDIDKTLPLTVYKNLFKLFIDFNIGVIN